MKAVILGATKGMGQALARKMAQRGDDVYLLGRNEHELQFCARDLEARSGRPVAGYGLCDLRQPVGFAETVSGAEKALGKIDTFVITAAEFDVQEKLEEDTGKTAELLQVNFANTVVLCEHVRKRLLAQGGGTLVVFSSVAGDRGRKPVIIYGASKAGLSHYLEGLDHKFRAQGLVTITVKPGFVKTGMTAGLTPPPFAGEPEQVADSVLKAIDSGKPLVYAPGIWRWVMFVIKRLPRSVMRKIGF